jgi:hypothetical protein
VRLICYPTSGAPPKLVPAPVDRAWMDRIGDNFAYRCLPLNIANAHGWMILNPVPFVAIWNGDPRLNGISIRAPADAPPIASSHFGSGVLTFGIPALFRTEMGYDLMVTGPLNQPKDGIQPLTGIVETDWTPFTFTMNWKFTRKNSPIAFERDEPFCMIFPVRRGLVEEVTPEIRNLETDPELAAAYETWRTSRSDFNDALRDPASPATSEKWQKDYFKASARFGQPPPDHRTKLKLKPFDPTPG